MSDRVDILCVTAHPDDAEISCAGTILRHVSQGRSVGLVELTSGELGTRGTPELRRAEAEASRVVIGAAFRYDLGLADGFFQADRASLITVITAIRRHRPQAILTNAMRDRHPDHGRGASLVAEAGFLSGLRKVITQFNGVDQEVWRPTTVLHAVQDRWIDPDLVIDISLFWEGKMEALRCFKSQFHDPASTEPLSPISRPDFLPFLEGRAREMGRLIGVEYGEGFTMERPLAIGDITSIG